MKKNIINLSWFFVILAGFMAVLLFVVSKEKSVFGVVNQNKWNRYEEVTLRLDGATIRAEIASTKEQMSKGLGSRSVLREDTGMLFIFDRDGKWNFWMRDMNFSIDIIWFDENFQVVDFKSGASPDSYPDIFFPNELSRYVLEVNAGFVEKYGVEKGDKLEIL